MKMIRLIAIFESDAQGKDADLEEVYVQSVKFNSDYKDTVCESLVDEVVLNIQNQINGIVDIYKVSNVPYQHLVKINTDDDTMISVGYITTYRLVNVGE